MADNQQPATVADTHSADAPRFDWSRMILLNQPAHGGHGGGADKPPFIVLTSEDVLGERPQLEPYRVERDPKWSVWAGGQPPPVYLSIPDVQTLHSQLGSPDVHHLEAEKVATAPPEIETSTLGVFDDAVFDAAVFDTGGRNGNSTSNEDETSTIAAASVSADGVGSALGDGEAVIITPEIAHAISARLQSADWTGIERRIASTPGAVDRVNVLIIELDRAVEQCGLTNLEQHKAKALTGALIKLVSSPEPEWRAIISILTSPNVTALLNFQAIAVIVAGISSMLLNG